MKYRKIISVVAAGLLFNSIAAYAQMNDAVVPNRQGMSTEAFPYRWDGKFWNRFTGNQDVGPLLVLAAQGIGTISSGDQMNFNGRGVWCVFDQTGMSGSPSTVISIQGKDVASGSYITLSSSLAITSNNAVALGVYPGAGATNFSSAPLPRTWRVSLTISGTSSSVTGTVGCSVLN